MSDLSRSFVVALAVCVALASSAWAAAPIEKTGPDFKSKTLGTTLKTTGWLPPGTEAKAELPVAVYAHNGRWDAPGAPSPEKMRDHLLGLGLAVVMLDYGKHEKATKPELWADGVALMDKRFFWAVNKTLGIEPDQLFVVPEGYTLRNGIHFFTSPDNGLKVHAWLLHPIASERPVPLAIRHNASVAWSGYLLAGLEFRGFARAWIGHPYHFDRKRGIFPNDRDTEEKSWAFSRSGVRTLRARAKEFNIDPDRFVIHGASKHGNHSVWVGVLSNEPAEDKKWGGMHHDVSSAVQCVAAEATWGFSEFWQADGAPKFHEWMGWQGDEPPSREWLLARSWTTYLDKDDPPMAIDRCHDGPWRTKQVFRLIKTLEAKGVPFIQSHDKKLPNYTSKRGDGWYPFIEKHLGMERR